MRNIVGQTHAEEVPREVVDAVLEGTTITLPMNESGMRTSLVPNTLGSASEMND